MGFCLDGFIFGLAILLPSALTFWLFPPRNTPENILPPRVIFVVCERVGQVACIAVLTLSRGVFSFEERNVWFWLAAAFVLAYYAVWARYLAHGRDWHRLYAPLWFLAVPLAVFPVLAFGFASLWGGSPWLAAAALVLGFGQIPSAVSEYSQF